MSLGASFYGCHIDKRSTRFTDSVFSGHGDRRDRGKRFAETAFKLLDLRICSVSTIQACILLGSLCLTEGHAESEVIYIAAANRMAQTLDLAGRSTANELERQINLRGMFVSEHLTQS